MKKTIYNFIFLISVFSVQPLFSQLVIDNTSMTPQQLSHNILKGSGVEISNIVYSGNIPNSIGYFTTDSLPTNLGLTSGIIISTGNVLDAPGPNSSGSTSTNNGTGSDTDLAALMPSFAIYDAAVLQFVFIPKSDTITLRYVFASDEYPEFAGSMFHDVFGFFLSGPGINGPYSNNAINIATVPNTGIPVSITNVGPYGFPQYYVDNNIIGQGTIEYDGFTTVLEAKAVVTPCVPYHLKIAIGDAGNANYDSAIFLEANGFFSNAIYSVFSGDSILYKGCTNAVLDFYLPFVASADTNICFEILGTAVNGVDYQWIDTCVTIFQNQQTTSLTIEPIDNGVISGMKILQLVLDNICDNDTITILIDDYEPLQLTFSHNTICVGDTLELFGNISGGVGPFTYEWSSGEQTPSIFISSQTPTVSTYMLTATDICSSSAISIIDSVIVSVHEIPTSDFVINSDTLNINDVLTIYYTGNATTTANYHWDFPGGLLLSGSGQGPINIKFDSVGEYFITLLVEDNNCFSDSTSLSVFVTSGTHINSITIPQIQIYPNPATEIIYIESTDFLDNIIITLSDIMGKQIGRYFITEEKTEINVSHLPKGIYFLLIEDRDKVSVLKISL